MSCDRKYVNTKELLPAVKSVLCEDNEMHRIKTSTDGKRIYFTAKNNYYFYPYKGETLYESWYA